MHFRGKQYHSVKRQAEQAMRWARAFGCDVAGESHASASSYFEVVCGQSVQEVRVSEHEPNYALRSDRDYMLYVGGMHAPDRVEAFQLYADWLGRLTGRPYPAAVKRYFTAQATREQQRQAREAELCRAETERVQRANALVVAVLAGMTPDERARWDELEQQIENEHGKARKRLKEKQGKLFERARARMGD